MRPIIALGTALVCSLVILAGCGATPSDTPATEPTPATTGTPTATQSPDERSPGDTGGVDTAEPSATDGSTPCNVAPLTAELELALRGEKPVQVTVTELGDRERVVVNETYRASTDRIAFGDDASGFEPATDYRVVVRTNDTVAWNRTVRRNQEYSLVLRWNDSVAVRKQVIVESPTPCPT